MMDWKEKRAAIIALCGKPHIAESDENIMIIPHVDSSDTKFLTSISASGATLAEAYDRLWDKMTGLPEDKHLCVRGGGRYRWNGYRWAEVEVG